MRYTKPVAIVASSIALATASVAGPVQAQEMAAGEITADTIAGTSAEIIVPLIIVALITLALSSSGGNYRGEV